MKSVLHFIHYDAILKDVSSLGSRKDQEMSTGFLIIFQI